jgi:protein TonB
VTTIAANSPAPALRGALGWSFLLHVVAIGAVVLLVRPTERPVLPPVYRVNLVAAPAGERQIGVVRREAPAVPAPQTPVAPPRRAEVKPMDMPAPASPKPEPRKAPAAATPTTETAPREEKVENVPTAGGGPTGGRGADVANVRTEGIVFPYEGYLNNITRQIAVRFKPDRRYGALKAEVFFMIKRDGSVDMSSFRFVTRSGALAFDLEAQGAVESAARALAFGPLPDGYGNDVLPVIFSFDPAILR